MPLDQVILNSADARDLRMMIAGIQTLLDLEKYLGFCGFSARFDKRPNCTLAVFLQPNDVWFERLRLNVDGLGDPGEPAVFAQPPDETEGMDADPAGAASFVAAMIAQGEGLSWRDQHFVGADPRAGKSDPDLASILPPADPLPDAAANAAASGAADPEPEPPADPPSVGDAVVDPIATAADGGGDPDITAPAISIPAPEAPPIAGTTWTGEEDERLIQLTINGVLSGLTKAAALREAARTMGRGEEAVKMRIYKQHVAARFNAVMAEAEAVGGPAAASPQEQAAPAAQAAPPQPQSALDAHLWGLPRDGASGWSWSDDLALMRAACAGWTMPTIAADLGKDTAKVKARFDLLTAMHRDADGRWARRFTREDVLAALDAHVSRNPGA